MTDKRVLETVMALFELVEKQQIPFETVKNTISCLMRSIKLEQAALLDMIFYQSNYVYYKGYNQEN